MEVGVEPAWLADPARVYPVAIDPTVAANASNPAGYGTDTLLWAGAPTANYDTYGELFTGALSGYATESFIKFNYLGVAPGAENVVTESHLMLLGLGAYGCGGPVTVHGIDATLSATSTWSTRPAVVGALVSSTTLGASCGSAWNSFDTTSLARRWITDGAPNNGLRVASADATDPAILKRFSSGNAVNYPILYITYDRLPTLSSPISPATGAVVTTATPTLVTSVATDPDGDTVKYWFRATPAPDAESGAKMIDSGWRSGADVACPAGVTGACYTAPVGALAEGVTYYWHVYTGDAVGLRLNPATPSTFRIDLGLGAKGAQPRDAIGPASVNLASGNVMVGAASPGFSTVNGTAGLSYAYNSQAPAALGLTGSYYNDGGSHVIPPVGTPAAMVRTDATINHYWGTVGPGPSVNPSNFMVRWTGFITAPVGGSYQFTADHDDGMRIWVNNVKILDHWSNEAVWNPSELAAPVTLTAGVAVPITVEYYQNEGAAFATVAVLEPNGRYGPVPPTWLRLDPAVSSPVLSPGWTLVPTGLSYVSAVLGDRWVAFVDASGAVHTYTWTGTAYAPPPGDDGVVGTDAAGALTLHATDGIDYAFDYGGRLVSATSALDDAGSASASSLIYTWSGGQPRLTKITDQATGRDILLTYGPSATGCAGTPVDALCQITYWDTTVTTVTKMTYSGGELARITDPGGVVSDFAYAPANGRQVLTYGALAPGQRRGGRQRPDRADQRRLGAHRDRLRRLAHAPGDLGHPSRPHRRGAPARPCLHLHLGHRDPHQHRRPDPAPGLRPQGHLRAQPRRRAHRGRHRRRRRVHHRVLRRR